MPPLSEPGANTSAYRHGVGEATRLRGRIELRFESHGCPRRIGFSDVHPKVIPGGLPGHRVRVGVAEAVALGGRSSEITWFKQEAFLGFGALDPRFQAPLRLPMAFQVHTVSASRPPSAPPCTRLCRELSTQTQSSIGRCHFSGLAIDIQLVGAVIWRSQALCEPQRWYIAIGRWVSACIGIAVQVDQRLLRTADTRSASGRNSLRSASRCRPAAGCRHVRWAAAGTFCRMLGIDLQMI